MLSFFSIRVVLHKCHSYIWADNFKQKTTSIHSMAMHFPIYRRMAWRFLIQTLKFKNLMFTIPTCTRTLEFTKLMVILLLSIGGKCPVSLCSRATRLQARQVDIDGENMAKTMLTLLMDSP